MNLGILILEARGAFYDVFIRNKVYDTYLAKGVTINRAIEVMNELKLPRSTESCDLVLTRNGVTTQVRFIQEKKNIVVYKLDGMNWQFHNTFSGELTNYNVLYNFLTLTNNVYLDRWEKRIVQKMYQLYPKDEE